MNQRQVFSPPPQRQTFTVKEVAALLGFSTNSIYKFLREGKIQSERLGRGRFRIPRSEIERFLSHHEHPGHALSPPSAAPAAVASPLAVAAAAAAIPPVLPLSVEQPSLRGTFRAFHPVGAPDLFEWFLGVALTLLGLSFLLFPREVPFPSGILSRVLTTLVAATGLAFLWLDLRGLRKRALSKFVHGAALLAVISFLLPYYWTTADARGLVWIGGLVFILLYSLFYPQSRPDHRYLLFLAALAAIAGAITVVAPEAFLPRLAAWGLWQRLLAYVVWLFLVVTYVLGAARVRAPRGRFALFFLPATVMLVAAAAAVREGQWDAVAFALPLGAFAMLFPFCDRFEHVVPRRRALPVLLFAWIGALLVGAGVASQAVYTQLQRSALAGVNAAAELGQRTLTEYLESARSAVAEAATNQSLAEALREGAPQDLLPFARQAYFSSAGTLTQVSILTAGGENLARYPVGDPAPAEAAEIRRISRDVPEAGGEVFLRFATRAGGAPPSQGLFGFPVFAAGGDLRGVVVGLTDGRSLHENFQRLRFRESGYLVLWNRENEIVYHSEPSLRGSVVPPRAFVAEAGGTGSTQAPSQGRAQYLTAFREVSTSGGPWTVAAVLPRRAAFRSGDNLVVMILATVLSTISGAVAFVVRLTRPGGTTSQWAPR